MKARKIVLGTAYVAVVSLSLLLAFGHRPLGVGGDDPSTASHAATQDPSNRAHPPGGLLGREVSSASRRTAWASPELVRSELEDLARNAVDINDLQDHPDAPSFLDWAHGLPGPEEEDFGRKVASCVVAYGQALTRPCVWQNEFVARRTAKRQGEVVYFQAWFHDDPEAGCRSMVSCIAESWQARKLPAWPTDKDYLALAADASPGLAATEGKRGRDFLAQWQELADVIPERIRPFQGKDCDEPKNVHVCRSNIAFWEHHGRLANAILDLEK